MGEYECIYSVGSVKTDYIPREAVRDLMYHKQSPLTEYDLDEIKAADVVSVEHGRWEKFTLGTYDFALRLRCSMCHKVVYEEEFKFCPYCGARMDDG